MRYNIIAWDLTSDPYPELICDTWETRSDAFTTLHKVKKESPRGRGIIIDWATTKVIAELKWEEIKVVKPKLTVQIRNWIHWFKNLNWI